MGIGDWFSVTFSLYYLMGWRSTMIDVTRMNGTVLTVNSDLIETVEEMPDTVITLTNGKKIIVKESRQEVKNLVKLYKKEIFCNI